MNSLALAPTRMKANSPTWKKHENGQVAHRRPASPTHCRLSCKREFSHTSMVTPHRSSRVDLVGLEEG